MKFKNKSVLMALGFSLIAVFQSCSDWTEITPIEPDYTNNKTKDPELYQEYLKNLRAYRETDHKAVYAWFDNSSKDAIRRNHHISNAPDSIDVIVLSSPDNLVERELKEIEEVRQRGTNVVYTIDFDAIKKAYTEYITPAEDEGESNDLELLDRPSFIMDKLQGALQIADKFNYDGIIFKYIGKSFLHMEADEKQEYIEDEQLFVKFANHWIKAHENKHIAFCGSPQNMIDKSLLQDSKHIIVNTESANNSSAVVKMMALANGIDIPSDRYIVTANLPSTDPEQKQVGYWADGTSAVVSTAKWATGNFSYTIAGMGVINVQNDYHTVPRIYAFTRDAINILNPSLK